MTYMNLLLVFIGIAALSGILGLLVALTEDKVRDKVRLSPSLKKKRKHFND